MAATASRSRRLGLAGEGLLEEFDGVFGVEAGGGDVGAEFCQLWRGRRGLHGVEPEGFVGDVDEGFGGEEVGLCGVDFGRWCPPKTVGTEGGFVGGGGALAGLPAGGGAEEDAEPVLIEEAFAVVVPDGSEDARGAEALAASMRPENVCRGRRCRGG